MHKSGEMGITGAKVPALEDGVSSPEALRDRALMLAVGKINKDFKNDSSRFKIN